MRLNEVKDPERGLVTSLFLELLLAAILDGQTKGRGDDKPEQVILLRPL